MGTVAKNSGGDFPKAPVGTHVARCYQVIDLGHQKIVWQGKEKWQPKVMFTWELCGEPMEDGRPFAVSNRYTLSLAETSALRPALESWRGKPFTEAELEGFDVQNVLGAYCMLGVVHNSVDGKVYANVSAILPLPKGMAKPAPVNDNLYFDIETDDAAKLPEWLQKTIAKSREKSGEPAPPTGKRNTFADLDDDIPFINIGRGISGYAI